MLSCLCGFTVAYEVRIEGVCEACLYIHRGKAAVQCWKIASDCHRPGRDELYAAFTGFICKEQVILGLPEGWHRGDAPLQSSGNPLAVAASKAITLAETLDASAADILTLL